MRVQIDGFRGGDRTSLDLPGAAAAAARAHRGARQADGARAAQRQRARRELGAGARAGHRRGVVSRPGRRARRSRTCCSATTTPAAGCPSRSTTSVADLPPFDDYAMAGRTYRFFDGTPLYPFGHGLSYTTFALRQPADQRRHACGGRRHVTVRVDVTNTGKRARRRSRAALRAAPEVTRDTTEEGSPGIPAHHTRAGADADRGVPAPRLGAALLGSGRGTVGGRECAAPHSRRLVVRRPPPGPDGPRRESTVAQDQPLYRRAGQPTKKSLDKVII